MLRARGARSGVQLPVVLIEGWLSEIEARSGR